MTMVKITAEDLFKMFEGKPERQDMLEVLGHHCPDDTNVFSIYYRGEKVFYSETTSKIFISTCLCPEDLSTAKDMTEILIVGDENDEDIKELLSYREIYVNTRVYILSDDEFDRVWKI